MTPRLDEEKRLDQLALETLFNFFALLPSDNYNETN